MQKAVVILSKVLWIFFFTALLPFAFLLDLLIYLGSKNDCINCGWENISKNGIYLKLISKKFKQLL